MNNKKVNKLFALPIILAGVIFAGAGVYLYLNDKSVNLSYILMGVGVLLFIIGIVSSIKTNAKYNKLTNVKAIGTRIEAKIVSIEMDNTVSHNGNNPYFVVCSAVNPISQNEESYRSQNVWFDIRKIIDDNHIEMLPVYIDPANSNNYYVDVEVLNNYSN